MKKSLALVFVALVAATLFQAPTASAIFPCEICLPDGSPTGLCIGSCNGINGPHTCSTWLAWNCPTIGPLTAKAQHPFDSLFPTPFYLQTGSTPAGC